MKNKAVVVVDIQKDFINMISKSFFTRKKYVNKVYKFLKDYKGLIICTKDSHSIDNCSFNTNGGKWDPHCVVGTKGEKIPKKILKLADHVIVKGNHKDGDSFSGFYEKENKPTTLDRILKENKIENVEVIGLMLKYCVTATARDAKKKGYKTKVIKSLCGSLK